MSECVEFLTSSGGRSHRHSPSTRQTVITSAQNVKQVLSFLPIFVDIYSFTFTRPVYHFTREHVAAKTIHSIISFISITKHPASGELIKIFNCVRPLKRQSVGIFCCFQFNCRNLHQNCGQKFSFFRTSDNPLHIQKSTSN